MDTKMKIAEKLEAYFTDRILSSDRIRLDVFFPTSLNTFIRFCQKNKEEDKKRETPMFDYAEKYEIYMRYMLNLIDPNLEGILSNTKDHTFKAVDHNHVPFISYNPSSTQNRIGDFDPVLFHSDIRKVFIQDEEKDDITQTFACKKKDYYYDLFSQKRIADSNVIGEFAYAAAFHSYLEEKDCLFLAQPIYKTTALKEIEERYLDGKVWNY